MRCSSCNKFVPNGDPEATVEDSDVNGTSLTGSIRIVIPCGECGTEMKDAQLDFDIEIEHECKKPKDDPEFELEGDVEVEAGDRYETTGKNGKALKPRYQKHFYTAEIQATVKCCSCNEFIEITDTLEEQASGFNEC